MTNEEKQKYKNKILKKLAESDDFNALIIDACKRHDIKEVTEMNRDIKQEGLLQVAKCKADYLIEVYEKSWKDFLRLALRIAERHTLSKPKKGLKVGEFLPKTVLKYYILHNSSFQQLHTVSTTDTYDTEHKNEVPNNNLIDEDEVRVSEIALLKCLSKPELSLVEYYYYPEKKTNGKKSRYLKDEIQYISQKIALYHKICLNESTKNISIDDKIKMVLSYREWIEYDAIFDEELNDFLISKLLKIDIDSIDEVRGKLINKIKNMDKTIIKNINKINEND